MEVCDGKGALVFIRHSINVLYLLARVRTYLGIHQILHYPYYTVSRELIIGEGIPMCRIHMLETQDWVLGSKAQSWTGATKKTTNLPMLYPNSL